MQGWVDLGIICAFTRMAQLFGHERPQEGNASDAEVHQVKQIVRFSSSKDCKAGRSCCQIQASSCPLQVAAILKEKSQQLAVSENNMRVKRAAVSHLYLLGHLSPSWSYTFS